MKTKILKSLSFIVLLVLSLTITSVVFADPDLYQYTGTVASGHTYNNVGVAKFQMTEGYLAFCLDKDVFIKTNQDYKKLPLESPEASFWITNPAKVRAILNYAWDKTNADEITAIQYALWHYMGQGNLPTGANANEVAIYNKLLNDTLTPPIQAGDENAPNTLSISQPSTPTTANSFAFTITTTFDTNLVIEVVDDEGATVPASEYTLTNTGNDYVFTLTSEQVPTKCYTINVTTLANKAVNAWAFFSGEIDSETEEFVIDKSLSQTVVGLNPTKSFQTKSIKVCFNPYTATGSLDLSGKKTLNGRTLAAGEFEFELYKGATATGTPVETVSNLADGTFKFSTLNYDLNDVGTTTYTVVEKTGSLGGVSYSGASYAVIVTITDAEDGTLNVVVANDNATTLNFTNTYKATGDLDLSGMKTLNGRELVAGEFEFELYDGETLLQTVSNAADGSFSFEKLDYTQNDVGTTTYTVIEKTGSLGGVSYSGASYAVIVTITDNGDGTLDVDEENGTFFACSKTSKNDWELGDGFEAQGLNGRALIAGEFEFELYEGETKLQTVSHAANGSFGFAPMNYTQNDVGTKTYTVKEKSGTLSGVTYATSVYTVTINISDNGDGTLKIIPSDNAAALTFVNVYDATGSLALSGTKTLNGRELVAGEFEFELYDGAILLETVSNAADGSISFTILSYDLGDVGTKTYTVKEVRGTLEDVIYATNEYTVTVTVADNGDGTLDVDASDNAIALNFENIQELVLADDVVLPVTGETNPYLIPGILLLMFAVATLALYFFRRFAIQ